MLVDLIKGDITLQRYICNNCSENNIGIDIHEEIDSGNIVIVKVDNYYNHLHLYPDCSPDCLIVQHCGDNKFIIYIVELRNISGPAGFSIKSIYEKYITCLDDFMGNRFGNYFHHGSIEIVKIRLVFVTDPYNFKQYPNKQLFMRGHKIDKLMATRLPKFFNKYLYIEHKLPNPVIRSCAK